jgi:hypothetical protein
MTSSKIPPQSRILRVNKTNEANFGCSSADQTKAGTRHILHRTYHAVMPSHSRVHFRFLSATPSTSDVIKHNATKWHPSRQSDKRGQFRPTSAKKTKAGTRHNLHRCYRAVMRNHSRIHFRFLSATPSTSDVIKHNATKSQPSRQ